MTARNKTELTKSASKHISGLLGIVDRLDDLTVSDKTIYGDAADLTIARREIMHAVLCCQNAIERIARA